MFQSPLNTSGTGSSNPSKRRAIDFFVSVSTMISSCAKQAGRVSKKCLSQTKSSNPTKTPVRCPADKSPPSKLMSSLMSSKVIPFRQKKAEKGSPEREDFSDGEFGDGGVWQRSIMMGEKCQPPDFSGVIYYDSTGKQVRDLPIRSPRASPLPSYMYKTREMN